MKSQSGLYPAVPTPIRGGEVDLPSIRRLVARLAPHVDGLTILGTTGESGYLEGPDRARVIDEYLAAASEHDLECVVGITTASTKSACHQAQAVEADCCTAFLVLPPAYFTSTHEDAIRHLRAVSEVTDRPLIHYEIPEISGLSLSGPEILELASQVPSVKGVKLSTADLQLVLALAASDLVLFAGTDDLLHEQLCEGCDAAMSPVAALVPEASRRWYDAVHAGRHDQAMATYMQEMLPVCHAMLGPDDFVAAVKRILVHVGVFTATDTLNGVPHLTPARERQVDAVLGYLDHRDRAGLVAETGAP